MKKLNDQEIMELQTRFQRTVANGHAVRFNGRRVTKIDVRSAGVDVTYQGRKHSDPVALEDFLPVVSGQLVPLSEETKQRIREELEQRRLESNARRVEYKQRSALNNLEKMIGHIEWALQDVQQVKARIEAGETSDYLDSEVTNRIAGIPFQCSVGYFSREYREYLAAVETLERENTCPIGGQS